MEKQYYSGTSKQRPATPLYIHSIDSYSNFIRPIFDSAKCFVKEVVILSPPPRLAGAFAHSRQLYLIHITSIFVHRLKSDAVTDLTPGICVMFSLSQDNRIKQYRAWLLGWVTAERSCPCKQPACPAVGGGLKVTFKPLVPNEGLPTRGLRLKSRRVHKVGIRADPYPAEPIIEFFYTQAETLTGHKYSAEDLTMSGSYSIVRYRILRKLINALMTTLVNS
ncbi:hypothetical protein J6590_056880 [Homalodisca vitripennis]|nr:hypothetical protein J6590_056880 [Homalodisca vitripennis]